MTIARQMTKLPEPKPHRFDPIIENRPSTLGAGPLRVAAFNAQGGTRFDAILECLRTKPLRDAAVLLMSEMDIGTRRCGRRDVARELAGALGMSYVYVPEFGLRSSDGAIHAYLGNAILSREPLSQVNAISLPKVSMRKPELPRSLGRYRREGSQVAIVATIKARGKAIRLAVTHLDSRTHPGGRELQIETILESFPDGPAIFGGDLNTTTVELINRSSIPFVLRQMVLNSKRFRHPQIHEPLFARLCDAGFEIRGANADGRATFTFARSVPPWMRPKLDWIALRTLRPVPGSAKVIPARLGFLAPRVSDHDFIVVDVAV